MQFAGKIYEPGEELIIPDGMRGPHRAPNTNIGERADVPLYDVIADKLPDIDTPPSLPLEGTHIEEREQR